MRGVRIYKKDWCRCIYFYKNCKSYTIISFVVKLVRYQSLVRLRLKSTNLLSRPSKYQKERDKIQGNLWFTLFNDKPGNEPLFVIYQIDPLG